jgi:hypothetical protein
MNESKPIQKLAAGKTNRKAVLPSYTRMPKREAKETILPFLPPFHPPHILLQPNPASRNVVIHAVKSVVWPFSARKFH